MGGTLEYRYTYGRREALKSRRSLQGMHLRVEVRYRGGP